MYPIAMNKLNKGSIYEVLKSEWRTDSKFRSWVITVREISPTGGIGRELDVFMPNKFDDEIIYKQILKFRYVDQHPSRRIGYKVEFLDEHVEISLPAVSKEDNAGNSDEITAGISEENNAGNSESEENTAGISEENNAGNSEENAVVTDSNKNKRITIRKVAKEVYRNGLKQVKAINMNLDLDALYNIAITYINEKGGRDNFTFSKRWDNLIPVVKKTSKPKTFQKRAVAFLAALFSLELVKGGDVEFRNAVEQISSFNDSLSIGKGARGLWILKCEEHKIFLSLQP